MANDEVVLDLTNYKDRVGSRVTPGRYRVFVEDAELDSTRDGKPMINVWLTVRGGTFEGSTVIDRLLPAHEKAQFRVVGFMQAIGLPTPKKRMKLNVRQFIGKVLDVDIEDGDPYNGRVKSEIRGYYRIEAAAKNGAAGGTDLSDLAGLEEFTTPAGPDHPVAAAAAVAAGAAVTEALTEPASAPDGPDLADIASAMQEDDSADEVDLDDLDL